MDSKNTPTINGSVIVGGKVYAAGQEAQLATAMQGKSFDRLLSKGVVSGDWGQVAADQPADSGAAPAEAPPEPTPAPKKASAKRAPRSKKGR